MNIDWTLNKKRGNNRPLLSFSITLEPWEQELSLPQVSVTTSIPKPPLAFETHCHPGEKERADGWVPEEFHTLTTPQAKSGTLSDELRLPWRADNAYPEVEAGFAALRDAFEAELTTAYDSDPIETAGQVKASTQTKRHVAPAVAARRLLGQK